MGLRDECLSLKMEEVLLETMTIVLSGPNTCVK